MRRSTRRAFARCSRIRSEYGKPQKSLTDAAKYVDDTYLKARRGALNRRTHGSERNREPTIVRPDDIDPHHRWDRPLPAPGHTQVDFEERVDFRRLHDYRLARTRAALANRGSARCCASTSTTSATRRAR